MAFSKQPQQSTYHTEQVRLMKEYNSRTSNFDKDIDYLNCYFESTKNKLTEQKTYDIFTRPGHTNWSDELGSDNIRKVYYWDARNKYYVWVNDDIKIIDGSGDLETTVN
jgi:hypothetical protein